jgi:hypothetical protein
MKTKTVYICDGCGEIIHPDKDEHYLLSITGTAHNFNPLSGEEALRKPIQLPGNWDLVFHGITGNCIAGYFKQQVTQVLRECEQQLKEYGCTPPQPL